MLAPVRVFRVNVRECQMSEVVVDELKLVQYSRTERLLKHIYTLAVATTSNHFQTYSLDSCQPSTIRQIINGCLIAVISFLATHISAAVPALDVQQEKPAVR